MRFATVLALAGLIATPALAAETVPVGPFTKVQLRGGGHVVVKHGAPQRVTLLKGSTERTRLRIRNGNELVIDACQGLCFGRYDLEIEIVTPELDGAAIDGGGEIVAQSGFPSRDHFAAAVNGGGDIDIHAISAKSVDAAVNGGGDIVLTATHDLNAAVSGGGDITYHGNPQVSEAVEGGGSVSAAR